VNLEIKNRVKMFGLFLRYNRSFSIGFTMLIFLLILGFGVSIFSPGPPMRWNPRMKDLPPSWKHPLGTTTVGQDLFWLITYAIKNSIILGTIGSSVGLAIGVPLGLISGYKGGLIEKVILFFADTITVIPNLLILMLFGALIKQQLNIVLLGTIIGLLTWGMPIRNVRSVILSLREREFTFTSLFSGLSMLKLLIHEYMPYVLPWIIASFMSRMLMSIGLEITLAIFGLSTLSSATLGTTIYWANTYNALVRGIWWWHGSAIIVTVFLVLALFLVNIGISTHFNPRARRRRMIMGV